MNHKGMIFDGESVRAILAGTKSMTRRVMKPQPNSLDTRTPAIMDGGHFGVWNGAEKFSCQYPPDSIMYVKETWAAVNDDGEKWIDYKASPKFASAGVSHPAGWENAPDDAEALRWRSPMMMPRSAARLWLRITAVKVERVQDASMEDCFAEGVFEPAATGAVRESTWDWRTFADRWNSINGKKPGCSWEANPWVWCFAFEKVDKPE